MNKFNSCFRRGNLEQSPVRLSAIQTKIAEKENLLSQKSAPQ